MSDEKLTGLTDFESCEAYDEVDRVVLRYAVAMTGTPVEVPDALFESLRSHFTERQLVELSSCIAWENYRARYDHALGIESQGFADGDTCQLK